MLVVTCHLLSCAGFSKGCGLFSLIFFFISFLSQVVTFSFGGYLLCVLFHLLLVFIYVAVLGINALLI